MNQPAYPFEQISEALLFEFESVGPSRRIKKIIEYAPLAIEGELYNLGLFDVTEAGEYDDLSVSNNQDLEKIMVTVVRTLLLFFQQHPNAQVFFTGSTASRTRLYRIVIGKVWTETQPQFELRGIRNDQIESFDPDRNYEGFLIRLGKENALIKLDP